MVNPFESIKETIVDICNNEFESCAENDTYFIAKGQEAGQVKQYILSKLPPEYAKMVYVDSLMYILDVNGDTFINIT